MSPLRHLRAFLALALCAFIVTIPASSAVAGPAPYGKPAPRPIKSLPKPDTPWMSPLAVELVTDGGFEAGGIGWSVAEAGNGQWFALAGTVAPISGLPVPAPPEGTIQAV